MLEREIEKMKEKELKLVQNTNVIRKMSLE